MKAGEVLKILRVSRPSLTAYVKAGHISVVTLPNGRYDYDRNSVMKFMGKVTERTTVIYGRVSTRSQKKDLENQLDLLKRYCVSQNYLLSAVYQDIASGLNFSDRKEFMELIDEVIAGKIERVVITYKDRLSRIAFDFFKTLFEKYACEIVVISEVGSSKLDADEVFDEIVHLLHCYSMKLYSSRRKKTIEDICKPI